MSSRCNLIASSSSFASSSPLCSELESLASKTNGQWLDLPDDLTEKILERLPITGYILFASVCHQWRTLQQNHRLRHSPSPPPMLNLPFFIPLHDQQTIISPFDPHHPPPPFILNFLSKRKYPSPHYFPSSFPCGWLLLHESPCSRAPDSFNFTLLNPISDVQFRLPVSSATYYNYKAAMSLTGPDSWSLFLIIYQYCGNDILFFRQGDEDWTELWNEDIEYTLFDAITNIVFYRGMFYFVHYASRFYLLPRDHNRLGLCLYVLDPDPIQSKPEVQFIEMDRSQIPTVREEAGEVMLVESDGDRLLVAKIVAENEDMSEVRVFKADLLRKIWVRMESIGDRVLVLNRQCCVSLVAADIGVRRNCIYYCCDHRSSWTVFDVGSGKVTNGSVALPPTSTHLIFLPRLCWSCKYS